MSDRIIIHGIKVSKEFVSETFGRLTTIGNVFYVPYNTKGHRKPFQVCQCSCGECLIVNRFGLTSGNSKSCGCLKRDTTTRRSTTHSRTATKEHTAWIAMRQRCNYARNENFKHYGGRGISVCERWNSKRTGFVNFLSDMGECPSHDHTIDRIDSNGDYTPENCRWATREEQARNKRNNRMLTHQGKTQCLADWSKETGIHESTILSRLKAGLSEEAALASDLRRTLRKPEKKIDESR